eukprot:499892_1
MAEDGNLVANMKDLATNVAILLPTMILLCSVIRHSNNIHNHTKWIVITYFLNWCINFISQITKDVAWSIPDKNNIVRNRIATICQFSLIISYSFCVIFICYFLKFKLVNTYKNTEFAINPTYVNILFIGMVLFELPHLSLRLLRSSITRGFISNNHIPKYLYLQEESIPFFFIKNISIYQLCTIIPPLYECIYFLIILCLFNNKLYKFIKLTLENDISLGMEIRNKVKHAIIKQTNLISIIVFATIIYSITYVIYNIFSSFGSTIIDNIMIYFIINVTQIITNICVYLTLQFCDSKYQKWCKRAHNCCVYCCTKLIHKRHAREYHRKRKHASYQQLVGMDYNYKFTLSDTTKKSELDSELCASLIDNNSENELCANNIYKCVAKHRIIDVLLNHLQEEKHICYSITNILNDFQHLLKHHDEDEEFHSIHKNLTENDHHQTNDQCEIYSRYYQRRREYDNDIKNNDVMSNILSKIHSFYFHSYDTGLRAIGEDKIMKRKRKVRDNELSKFSSDINVQDIDDDHGSLMYNFGQRFQYEDSKNRFYVLPKYTNIKQELVDNKICKISVDIYHQEYNKCMQFMKTKQVKNMHMRGDIYNHKMSLSISPNHILSLLIYCNCDEFQNKWSSTYRRIPSNEDDLSLRKRHSYFYFVSKYLNILVEDFGDRLIEYKNNNKSFFHGVSKILYFTKTCAQFHGPLSTSTDINVAVNFSNNIGIILQLQYLSSTYPLKAKYFNCAFFSDYPNERECLFVGGIPMMLITNIINVSNAY